jgi:hypothetical protein
MPVQLKAEDTEGFWNWTADTFLISCRAGAWNLATALEKEALIHISGRLKEQ